MTDLQTLIDNTADNTTLVLPPETMDNPTTVFIKERKGLTIDGTGAILKRATAGPGLNRQIQIIGSQNVTIHNLTIKGPKPDTVGYQAAFESQHAIAIDSSSQVNIDHCVMQRSWGDHFYLSGGCNRIVLSYNSGSQCGRHGISVNCVDGLDMFANTFDFSHRWSVDIEPTTSLDFVRNCHIVYNAFYRPTIGFVTGVGRQGNDVATTVVGLNTQSWGAPPA